MNADTEAKLLFNARVTVRWGDMDAFNHVNNAVYSTYLEEARLRWFATFDGAWERDDSAPVIAAMNIDFRRPIVWPAEVVVELFAGRVGRSSIATVFRMSDRDVPETVYAEGECVMVWIDPRSGKSVGLPEAVLKAMATAAV